ncbi:hypothetical protein [Mycobacterium shimoidei]|uniref:hypothetical protein n=1 Tax=Mycobacterium shimoidei TaxID=29313 RepID=UPI000848D9F4|nr:hypothetical protein [Mycobacterium shimoidei]MCV7258064.1 hypothetical protein [Mycobacterium shimoidei]ODR12762.1 hypothetical protein BHQ16_13840 [Mycobacterium shimoidei]ORW83488.1 hypothetical protein AWC26_01830 [Mycobacterium shimoidei]
MMIRNRIRIFIGTALLASAVAAPVFGPIAVANGMREPMPQRWCTNGITGFYSNGDECPPGFN